MKERAIHSRIARSSHTSSSVVYQLLVTEVELRTVLSKVYS